MTRDEMLALANAEIALASMMLERSKDLTLPVDERCEAMQTGFRATNRANQLVALSRTASGKGQRRTDARH